MATQQDEGGVPFSIAHELQHFRLLELPAELLELIDAPDPPPLCIKSKEAPSSGAPHAKPAYAVLCTPNKAFHIRQVQTSNSVFVTAPALDAHSNEMPVPATRAIASCTATLELHPVTESASAYLEEVLPVYDVVDGEADVAGNGASKQRLLSHVPLSEAQCEAAWRQLMAFEFAGSSFRPSANTLSQVWRAINAAALAEGIQLDSQFLIGDLLHALDEEAYPAGLVQAIVSFLSSDDQDSKGAWSCLDRPKAVQFVGKTLLEARQGQPDYPTAEFLDTWRDCMPESWRTDAELQAIDGLYELPSSTTICVKGSAGTAKSDGSSAGAGSASRKWHERFGRARKK